MRLFFTFAVLLAALVAILGLVCLSLILPGLFALLPWVAGWFLGCAIGEALGEIWNDAEPLEV